MKGRTGSREGKGRYGWTTVTRRVCGPGEVRVREQVRRPEGRVEGGSGRSKERRRKVVIPEQTGDGPLVKSSVKTQRNKEKKKRFIKVENKI